MASTSQLLLDARSIRARGSHAAAQNIFVSPGICFYRKSSLLVLVALLVVGAAPPAMAQQSRSIPEEIEWTWEVRPPHPDPRLPNVLLLGDSISRAYFPKVTKELAGVANLYLMASSTS